MNKREKGLLAPTDVKMTVAQLEKLPLRIVQQMTHSKSRDKKDLTASFGFVLDQLEIELFQSIVDPNVVNVVYMGDIIGRIVTKRGRQLYVTMLGGTHDVRTDWEHFLRLMTERREEKRAQQSQSDREDASYSADERAFIQTHGTLAEDILSQMGRTDVLELVRDDRGEFRVVDTERDNEPVIWTNADTRLWGTSVHRWGQRTPYPLEHLTEYVNKLS